MMLRGTVLVMLLWFLSPHCLSAVTLERAAGVKFFRERVTVEILSGQGHNRAFRVCGLYHFRNRSENEQEQMIFYPFPVTGGFHYPESIRVSVCMADSQKIPLSFDIRHRGITFSISVCPDSSTTIRIDYIQHTESAEAMYITTTAKAWQRPIDLAEFVVLLPNQLRLKELSYPPEHVERLTDQTRYCMQFVNFVPDKELTVQWDAGN
jgi:hypothetical protein